MDGDNIRYRRSERILHTSSGHPNVHFWSFSRVLFDFDAPKLRANTLMRHSQSMARGTQAKPRDCRREYAYQMTDDVVISFKLIVFHFFCFVSAPTLSDHNECVWTCVHIMWAIERFSPGRVALFLSLSLSQGLRGMDAGEESARTARCLALAQCSRRTGVSSWCGRDRSPLFSLVRIYTYI